MINSVAQTSPAQYTASSQNSGTQALSSEQTKLIEETLAEFDVDSLSSADAMSIVESFSEAGIMPGQALEEAMAASGFDARSVGELAGAQRSEQGPPPPQGGVSALNISDDQLTELNELLTSLYDENSDIEKESLLSSIQQIIQDAAPDAGLVDILA